MTYDRRDPDFWRDLADRKLCRDEEFAAGKISETVYLVSLSHYGYTPRAAQIELFLLRASIADVKKIRQRKIMRGERP